MTVLKKFMSIWGLGDCTSHRLVKKWAITMREADDLISLYNLGYVNCADPGTLDLIVITFSGYNWIVVVNYISSNLYQTTKIWRFCVKLLPLPNRRKKKRKQTPEDVLRTMASLRWHVILYTCTYTHCMYIYTLFICMYIYTFFPKSILMRIH